MTAPASQSYTSMTAPASQSHTSRTAPAAQSYTSMTATAAQSHTSMTAPAARPHTSMTAPAAQSHVSPIASVIQSNAPLTAPAAQSYATQYSAAPMTLAPPATRAQVVIPSYEQPRSRPQYELNPAVEEFMPIGYHPRHTSTPAQQYMPQPQVQQNSQTTDVLQQLVTLLSKKDHLPSMEPEVFKGDRLMFMSWLRSFETLIEAHVSGDEERLYYLGKYTTGEAKQSINGYLTLSGPDIYTKAKAALKKTYGSQYHIAEAYKKELAKWPNIKTGDGPALKKFADFLEQCNSAISNTRYLESLNSADENQKLVKKIPRYLADRWNRIVDRFIFGTETERESYGDNFEGSFPPFAEFTKFIANEARIACGPGLIGLEPSKDTRDDKARQRAARSFATNTSTAPSTSPDSTPRKPYCNVCRGEHYAENCEKFRNMNIDERRQEAKKKGFCFKCLKKGHLVKDCRRIGPSLLFIDLPETEKKEKESHPVSSFKVKVESSENFHSSIIPVQIKHVDSPNKVVSTYALLDNQSNACFMSESLLSEFNVKKEKVSLSLTTMAETKKLDSEIVQGFSVKGIKEEKEVKLPEIYTRECIPADKSLIPTSESIQQWDHLKEVAKKLEPYNDKMEIGLLLGYNCSAALLPKEVVTAEDDDPYAVRTVLGWSVVGTIKPGASSHSHFVFRTQVKEVSPRQIKDMYDHDYNELSNKGVPYSNEDVKFMKKMEGIRHQENGHYEIPLPFTSERPQLPNNRDMVMKRFRSLKTKLIRNEKYRSDYLNFMSNLIESEHAEIVPDDELKNNCAWYIPHHGIYHPKKPDKLRVVFDCSASYKGHSLNDHLLQGPDQMNNLSGVMCRFREEKVGFVCDIEGMFHQVNVAPKDRDYLRFLWSPDIMSPPSEYRMTVHLFGATSSPGCAMFALRRTAQDHEEECGKEAADFVKRNFYVDDGLKSVETIEEAAALADNAIDMCKRGGFKLHKFMSTHREVLEDIPSTHHAKDLQKLNLRRDKLPVSRTLGIEWCVEEDEFQFQVEVKDHPVTRRAILSTVSSIFDPLGLVCPVLLGGRKILQQLCRDGCSWDDPISDDLEREWNQWTEELPKLSQIHIPRCYKAKDAGKDKEVELHHFSDASMTAYGQCSYLRIKDIDGNITTSLVMAKSRVAPTKTVTVPRLELMAATLSVKVAEFLDEELDYCDIKHFFWTDSQIVLGYISNEARRFHVFVANRVQRIRDFSSPEQWYHVSTTHNPADLASRGMSATEMIDKGLWWKGPDFLQDEEIQPEEIPIDTELLSDPEVKKTRVLSTKALLQTEKSLDDRLKYFSSWQRARRAIAVCLRFKRQLLERKTKKTEPQNEKKEYQPVDVTEMKVAETVIIKAAQEAEFNKEIKMLQDIGPDRQSIQKRQRKLKNSKLLRLDPFLQDGMLRVGGRIKRANFDLSIIHPVIIPKNSQVAQLLIAHFHQKTGHMGANTTLSEIRASGYWILSGKSMVAAHVYKCVTCRKLRGKTQLQKMADLPEDRLDPSPPFTYSAVDLFGPFLVKEGRSQRKRWGAMFVCMVSRAIHIEVVHDLTTDSFINAYRRFISRRGPIRQLRCDRGTNFVGAKNELDSERIRQKLTSDDCDYFEFKMNFPHASHMGGVWERMIRSARNALSSLLISQPCTLDDELLHTLLLEAEAIVNSRPLTYNSTTDVSSEPLTPMQLLTLKSKEVFPPPGAFVKEDLYCRKRWRKVQYLATQFWRRWISEFIPTLQERKKWQGTEHNLKQGDIVLLVDENSERCRWPKGIVIEAFPSKDNLVRKVKIKTQHSVFERPVHKLVLLYRCEE